MKLKLFWLIFFLFFLIKNSSAEIKKVISLSPATTEIIFFTESGDKLIADTIYCTIPEKAKEKEKIGGIINPNVEKIVSLKPDIVVGTSLTPKQVISLIKKFKIPVKIFTIETVKDIENATISIGNLLGKDGKKYGKKFYKSYTEEIRKLKTCFKGKKTLIIFSTNPIYTAGNSTYLGEIIKDAGGINLAGNGKYKIVSPEYIISKKPDFIIFTSMINGREKLFKNFQIKTIKIKSDYLLKPGPYIIEGIKELRKAVCEK
ncbi:helical backbone metal receptor [Desulfurobacterium atlanticum]|uniref:Iron complex transport system substrate-binding protein n=1 Tax=Desulfurobacterium atlanticum TaxID=240169 RepID=A0A238YCK0_9BACT|nr:helical backbone metal receptor [Desulfurobacterium atlanticum]SNR68333.1 iron complex transport system substrate-binding protein [Desulfurobacterium atlanticum]